MTQQQDTGVVQELRELEGHLEADEMSVGRTAWGAHVARSALALIERQGQEIEDLRKALNLQQRKEQHENRVLELRQRAEDAEAKLSAATKRPAPAASSGAEPQERCKCGHLLPHDECHDTYKCRGHWCWCAAPPPERPTPARAFR